MLSAPTEEEELCVYNKSCEIQEGAAAGPVANLFKGANIIKPW